MTRPIRRGAAFLVMIVITTGMIIPGGAFAAGPNLRRRAEAPRRPSRIGPGAGEH